MGLGVCKSLGVLNLKQFLSIAMVVTCTNSGHNLSPFFMFTIMLASNTSIHYFEWFFNKAELLLLKATVKSFLSTLKNQSRFYIFS